MDQVPASVRPLFRRLRRRLAIGLFLEVWPGWAIAGLLVSGTVALACRMFFANAAPMLRWLWLVPALSVIPVLWICFQRAYRPRDVVALADSLGGGQGILLTLLETHDSAWARSELVDRATRFEIPRYRLSRTMAALLPAIAFLVIAMMLPQRRPEGAANPALAQQIAADLKAAVVQLKKDDLITPADEQKLEEEIERIQKSAEQRMDASAWEAADAMKEQMVSGLSEKQEAVKWAQDSLARYAAAAKSDGAGSASATAQSAELQAALAKLAQNGMLGNAPPDLLKLAKGGQFPTDAATLAKLTAELGKYLGETGGKFADLAQLGKEFGRFDPSEFPLNTGPSPDGDGAPGRGGVNRGRGDADLTWGKETQPYDKFKSQALPQGAPRSPDDWAPVVTLPGAPQVSPILSTQAAARQYAAAAGQTAWRRSLAPRHLTAVKKYFDKDKDKKDKDK